MDEHFHERFAQALSRSGKTLQEIGDLFGISPQSVEQWKKGTTRPKSERLRILAQELGVTTDWLQWNRTRFPQDGDDSATIGRSDYEDSVARIDNHLGRHIPLVELEDIAVIQDAGVVSKFPKKQQQISSHFPCSGDSIAFSMRNKSMEPDILAGDIVVIDPRIEPEPGDLVLVKLLKDGGTVLRKYSRGIAGAVILLPANHLWEELRFTAADWESDAQLVGVMSEHTRPRRT